MFVWVLKIVLKFNSWITKFSDKFIGYVCVEFIEFISNFFLVSNYGPIVVKIDFFVIFGSFVVDNLIDSFPYLLRVTNIAFKIPIEILLFVFGDFSFYNITQGSVANIPKFGLILDVF